MPRVTFDDLSLTQVHITDRVSSLKASHFAVMPELCVERAWLVTTISRELGHFQKSRLTSLDKAQLYRAALERRRVSAPAKTARASAHRSIEVDNCSLFLGSTTQKQKGVILYPEFMGLSLWPELRHVSTRKANPYYLAEADLELLNHEVFPYWTDRNITELLRKREAQRAVAAPSQPNLLQEIQLLQHLVFFLTDKPNCVSHTIPDFSRAINDGLGALMDEAKRRETTASTREQADFFRALVEAATGIVHFAERLADAAQLEAANTAEPARSAELRQLADLYRRVPLHPARSFHEGLITVWVCWMAIHLENANVGLSLGRLDQLLYPLYAQDIANGTLSVPEAVELLACLWLKIGDHLPLVANAGEQLFGGTGSNQAITIGGVDAHGEDAVNDLSYVILRATELLGLRDPNLNARYCSTVNSKEYLRRLCEANLTTGATPALHNDHAIISALTSKGETLEQARDYAIVGCVEPGSAGRTYGNSAAVLLNLVSALELTLFNGRHRHTGLSRLISVEGRDPDQFTSFDELKDAFLIQLRWLIERSCGLNLGYAEIHQQYHPLPILSSLFEGPMLKGRDLVDGGALVNFSGATIIGFADVVDSLSAIEQLVYREKRWSLAKLRSAITTNFDQDPALLAQLRNPEKTPKFGNDAPSCDANAHWLVHALDRLFSAQKNSRGGTYRVGYWTMTNHAGFGRMLPATANGRRSGENLASGITPVSNATPHLAAVLNSVAKLPASAIACGMALNLKFTRSGGDREALLDHFSAYVEGYFDHNLPRVDGGMEIQFNITSRETFINAVEHPEQHPQLLVRVSGYTAYFKDLTPQMQKEIIDRTEYELHTGLSHNYGPYALTSKVAES